MASSGGFGFLHLRRGDNTAAYFANSIAKEACDDHGRSGEQHVPVTPRRRIGSGNLKEVEDE